MTSSIIANSVNKHMADFGNKQRGPPGSRLNTATKKVDDFDDSKSEASQISYATSS
jgi:hypothetical protein